MAQDEGEPEKLESREIAIDWVLPMSMPAVLADHMLAQYDAQGKHFIIALFESKQPVLTSKEDVEEAKKLTSIPAQCVGRFIVPFDRLPHFAKAFDKTMIRAEAIRKALAD